MNSYLKRHIEVLIFFNSENLFHLLILQFAEVNFQVKDNSFLLLHLVEEHIFMFHNRAAQAGAVSVCLRHHSCIGAFALFC